MNQPRIFVAAAADEGQRIDVVVARRSGRSRSAAAGLVRAGCVRVAAGAVRPSHIVRGGERISVAEPPVVRPSAKAQSIPLCLVYDDADLCVVDKPAGMATHPAPGSPDGTLVNALLARLGKLPAINGALRPGIVHRLDKGTSGLLVVAKSDAAMRALSAAIGARAVKRGYDAVVWGSPRPAAGTVDAPLGRDSRSRLKFAVREGGRQALTDYRTAEIFGIHALPEVSRAQASTLARLALSLKTGRTHQIRVHCAAIGHPIVGDELYAGGRAALGMRRQALHAARLEFAHPITGATLRFESPWPNDFAGLVDRLRRAQAP
ncbi:MAG: RluA family pseudouridine synthase [Candidatus Eremiobacteraeota bacterium]|nr:RluA family pseudouridine synthase [Candidatus Eremiobacteraeota bacterium]